MFCRSKFSIIAIDVSATCANFLFEISMKWDKKASENCVVPQNIACKQAPNMDGKRFGWAQNRGPIDFVFDMPIHPWWLACNKSFNKVITPVNKPHFLYLQTFQNDLIKKPSLESYKYRVKVSNMFMEYFNFVPAEPILRELKTWFATLKWA